MDDKNITEMLDNCSHPQFESEVSVFRLTEEEGGDVYDYTADIKIRCALCKTNMIFKGMSVGMSPSRPMISADGIEARMPLMPQPEDENKNQYPLTPDECFKVVYILDAWGSGFVNIDTEILVGSIIYPKIDPDYKNEVIKGVKIGDHYRIQIIPCKNTFSGSVEYFNVGEPWIVENKDNMKEKETDDRFSTDFFGNPPKKLKPTMELQWYTHNGRKILQQKFIEINSGKEKWVNVPYAK